MVVAIYHCKIKNIGRSKGKSAVASSAYRSGEKLHDEELGKTFDYTSKDNVVYSEIILCENAPKEYQDRQKLWNEVQKIEKAKDARLAREWEVALPNELPLEKAKELTRGYAQSLANEGMCVDYAIHWKDGNHHAHIMGTTRAIKENGEWAQKEKKVYKLDENGQKIPQIDPKTGEQKIGARGRKMWQRETVEANDWNKTEKVEEWRERWANHCNRYLEKEQQIDHRSYERQGIEQIPTIHEGYVARKMEQRGEVSELCEYNREVKAINQERKDLEHEIAENRAIIEVLRETDSRISDLEKLSELEERELEYTEAYRNCLKATEAIFRDGGLPVVYNKSDEIYDVNLTSEQEPSKALNKIHETKATWDNFVEKCRERLSEAHIATKKQRGNKYTTKQEKPSMSLVERFKGYLHEKAEERAGRKTKIVEERAREEQIRTEGAEKEAKVKEILERKPHQYDYQGQIEHIQELYELYQNNLFRQQSFDALRPYTTNWQGYQNYYDAPEGYVEKGVNDALERLERMKERFDGFQQMTPQERFKAIQEQNKDKIAKKQEERVQGKEIGGHER